MKHMRIDGDVSQLARHELVTEFQTNSQMRAAVLSIKAAGVGLTLTVCWSYSFDNASRHFFTLRSTPRSRAGPPSALFTSMKGALLSQQRSALHTPQCILKDSQLTYIPDFQYSTLDNLTQSEST